MSSLHRGKRKNWYCNTLLEFPLFILLLIVRFIVALQPIPYSTINPPGSDFVLLIPTKQTTVLTVLSSNFCCLLIFYLPFFASTPPPCSFTTTAHFYLNSLQIRTTTQKGNHPRYLAIIITFLIASSFTILNTELDIIVRILTHSTSLYFFLPFFIVISKQYVLFVMHLFLFSFEAKFTIYYILIFQVLLTVLTCYII